VNAFLADVRRTVVPERGGPQGPLPSMLVGMTIVTGLVDAFSYLVLGHVFVANMTGNVVFLGFALAGASGFSITASLTALSSFWVGALIGGWAGSRLSQHRGRFLGISAALESACLVVAVVLAALSGISVVAGYRYPLIVVLAVAMGVQNATARKLSVPDLTTTVLTLTITGTAADSAIAGGKGSTAGRRFTSVTAMFVGALIGAVLVVHRHIAFPLAVALALLVSVGLTAHQLGRSDPEWVHP
jgi:uncharacterized membrane protein YoaK (UPF0700 family)